MIKRLLAQTAVRGCVAALLLFGGAGTLRWPSAWVFLALMGCCSLGLGLWLARHNPALLAERLAPFVQAGQKSWDRVLTLAMTLAAGLWFLLMALDAGRWQLMPLPFGAQILGTILIAAFFAIIWAVMRANNFAIPVVKIQENRSHAVASGGPYKIVRHPMYAATLLFYIGAPLLLGSSLGLLVSPLLAALLVLRTEKEDAALLAELPGYMDYAKETTRRLIPFVW